MAASVELQAYVDDITTCAICLENFDNPKSLPCLHTFCFKCIDHHCAGKRPMQTVSCPTCREEFYIPPNGVAGLKRNFYVEGLIGIHKDARHSESDVLCEVCALESGDK